VRREIYQQIKTTIAKVERSASPIADFTGYKSATRAMIDMLLDQGHHPHYMDQLSARLGADAVAHATAVAHLSLVIGLRSEQYLIDQRNRLSAAHARDVVNLGVAGMLHDIGKTKLPPELRDCTAVCPPESPAERAAWEEHSRLGYEMIHGGLEPSASATVLHHHQHFDGSGFPPLQLRGSEPTRPAGEAIHIFGRILQLADVFDHLSAPPAARRPNVEILHALRTRYHAWLDPHLLAQLPKIVPPFPPGAKVRLSDGRNAVVTGFNIDDPYHPTVKRLGVEGKTIEPEPLRLGVQTGLSIVQVGNLPVTELMPTLAAA
jgi:HD-GYP domain-containing protein (c-di-GMP phosphodiesterase class II)